MPHIKKEDQCLVKNLYVQPSKWQHASLERNFYSDYKGRKSLLTKSYSKFLAVFNLVSKLGNLL